MVWRLLNVDLHWIEFQVWNQQPVAIVPLLQHRLTTVVVIFLKQFGMVCYSSSVINYVHFNFNILICWFIYFWNRFFVTESGERTAASGEKGRRIARRRLYSGAPCRHGIFRLGIRLRFGIRIRLGWRNERLIQLKTLSPTTALTRLFYIPIFLRAGLQISLINFF